MIKPPDNLIAKPGDAVCGNINRHVPVGSTVVIKATCILLFNHGWLYHFTETPHQMWWKD